MTKLYISVKGGGGRKREYSLPIDENQPFGVFEAPAPGVLVDLMLIVVWAKGTAECVAVYGREVERALATVEFCCYHA